MHSPTLSPQSWTPRHEMDNLLYYIDSLIDGWRLKMFFACVITVSNISSVSAHVFEHSLASYSDLFGGDHLLIRLLLFMMLLDLIVGLIWAFKTKDPVTGIRMFSWGRFGRGISKYPIYFLYILIVGIVSVSISRSLSSAVGTATLNLFVSYMIAGEAGSILKRLEKLGFQIPVVLRFFVFGTMEQIEKMFKKKFSSPCERQNTPNTNSVIISSETDAPNASSPGAATSAAPPSGE